MKKVTSNLAELTAHIQKMTIEIYKSQAMKAAAYKIGDVMKEDVLKALDNAPSSYDYRQMGLLRLAIDQDDAGEDLTRKRKATVYFGGVDHMFYWTKRHAQTASFYDGRRRSRTDQRHAISTFTLRAERDLPSWIIMEFGRQSGNSGANPRGIPKMFLVSYTPRDSSKNQLIGPSLEAPGGNRKPVYYFSRHRMSQRRHPGIKEGRFYRNGLKKAKPKIYDLFAEGLFEGMQEYGRLYGVKVERGART